MLLGHSLVCLNGEAVVQLWIRALDLGGWVVGNAGWWWEELGTIGGCSAKDLSLYLLENQPERFLAAEFRASLYNALKSYL